MHQHRSLALPGTNIATLLQAEPEEFARHLGLDSTRVGAILERVSQPPTAGAGTPLSALGQRILRHGRLALLDALLHVPTETGLRLFEEADLHDLLGRWALIPYLLENLSFLTIDELAEVLEEFADHLTANRLSLESRGVPQTTLGASWPGMLLSYLYPTKSIFRESSVPIVNRTERPSPRNRALKHLPAIKRATRVHTYWWMRAAPSSSEDLVLQEPYEEAARQESLDEETAARVEAGRAAFLNLEIDVLRTLANALRTRDDRKLWPQCLCLLTEALRADDAALYLQMDQWSYGYDVVSGKGQDKGYLPVFPGGLSNLLLIIGSCEKELAIGTMDRTKSLLPPAVRENASFGSYFQAVGHPWEAQLDQALDHFAVLESQEASFWTEYRERVNEAIENEFYAEVVVRTKVRQKWAGVFEPHVRTFAEWSSTHLELAGTIPMLQLSLPDRPIPERANMIRKDDGIWTIRYAGTTVHLPHVMGLEYLAYLLRHPGRDYGVEELDATIRGNLRPASDISGGLSLSTAEGFRVGGIGDAGDQIDKESEKTLQARQRQLSKALKKAVASGNTAAADEIRSEQAWIRGYLKQTLGLGGRPRKANDSKEKARINVQRHIKRATGQIEQRHPVLGAYLTSFVRTGDYCIYDPPLADRVPWTF